MSTTRKIPVLPEISPFSPDQRAWLNGYFAGLFSIVNEGDAGFSPEQLPEPVSRGTLLLLVGSQSGTADALSLEFKKQLETSGFDVIKAPLNDYEKVEFQNSSHLLIITSTWGDGEPPDNATEFWTHITSDNAPQLEGVNFSVLALGDSNYAEFCGFGVNLDKQLSKLGAKRIFDRVDCDVDYEENASAWFAGVLPILESQFPGEQDVKASNQEGAITQQSSDSQTKDKVEYNRKNPFPAPYRGNIKLNGEGSKKDTRHVIFSIKGADWSYECGDSLGVFPKNCPEMASLLLEKLGIDGSSESVTPDGKTSTVLDRVLTEFNISKVSKKFANWVAKTGNYSELEGVVADKEAFKKHTEDRDLIDFLEKYPLSGVTADELFASLGKLQARLYSIASSPKKHPDEIHLTVGVVTLDVDGRTRKGVCSTYMADRIEDDSNVPTFLQSSKTFKLPTDLDTPIIMIGPGTGIAPFLAFLQERESTAAKGDNWLFFGDQHEATDFLYKDELTGWVDSGLLQKLDTAFSRDQKEKIYVQNRMYQNGQEFWNWLERGAIVYVCGDAKRMAVDVDNTLRQIIEEFGKVPADQVDEFMKNFKSEGRYLRDVY